MPNDATEQLIRIITQLINGSGADTEDILAALAVLRRYYLEERGE
jgi:hypothetical protein